MQTYKSEADLTAALQQLADSDAVLAAAFAEYGTPPLRKQLRGFAGLARLLISQQVSTAAAAAIQAKFEAAIGTVTAENFLALSGADLAACGISRPKQAYLRGLAEAAADGSLDFKKLDRAADAAVYETLTALKGIGPWTAQCYLLFSLRRPDMFPAGDLALQEGVKMLYGLAARPSAADLAEFAGRWQPHRGAAARLIWQFYNGELDKQRAAKR